MFPTSRGDTFNDQIVARGVAKALTGVGPFPRVIRHVVFLVLHGPAAIAEHLLLAVQADPFSFSLPSKRGSSAGIAHRALLYVYVGEYAFAASLCDP